MIRSYWRLVVAKKRNVAKQTRVLPRTSKAIGGPMPGIDLTDFSALQELDDLEYVQRIATQILNAIGADESSAPPA